MESNTTKGKLSTYQLQYYINHMFIDGYGEPYDVRPTEEMGGGSFNRFRRVDDTTQPYMSFLHSYLNDEYAPPPLGVKVNFSKYYNIFDFRNEEVLKMFYKSLLRQKKQELSSRYEEALREVKVLRDMINNLEPDLI